MKTIRKLILAAVAMAFVASASAQTTIYILGSNGDRTATQNGIKNILAVGWTFEGNKGADTQASTNGNAVASNYGAWNGTWNSNPVIIKVSFAGAVAGIAAVAGNLDARFVKVNGDTGTKPKDPYADATAVLNTDYILAKPDFGFSTNFQTTSPFTGTYLGTTYATLNEETVGASALIFYGSPGFPGTPSSTVSTNIGSTYTSGSGYVPNITTQLAQLLFSTGYVRLSLFTGDPAHENKYVYALGRNTDAGQRFGVNTEIGLGTTTPQNVYLPTVTGAVTTPLTYGGTVSSQQQWPVSEQNSQFLPVTDPGNGGFSTGALLANALTTILSSTAYQYADPSATGGFYVGYVTPSDGSASITNASIPDDNKGVALKYNGVPFSVANVRNGSYTAWVYNRIIRRNGTPATTNGTLIKNFADALRTRIKSTDAAQGQGILINDGLFRVVRYTDGGQVINNF